MKEELLATTTNGVRHYINGEWVGSPEVERRNPASSGDVVAVSASGDSETVRSAVEAAKVAQVSWESSTLPSRGAVLARAAEILESRSETIARDLTREEGKTLAESRGEVRRAIDIFRFFAGEGMRMGGDTFPSSVPDTLVYSRRQPLGVVGLITPWNFPIAIPAWKMAPALIAGNAVVIKPATITPTSVWHLARSLDEAGLPPGVLNVVNGPGSSVGTAIARHPDVAGVSFTGSTSTGRGIHELVSARMGRVQLEMGGKNALVILDDADVERAAQIAATGAFGLTGQACTATSRIICTSQVHDEFVEAFVREAERYRPTNGLLEDSRMGPVVSHDQLATNQLYVGLARDEGGVVVTTPDEQEGLYFSPVVVTQVSSQSRISQEEVFGPVAAVLQVEDLDAAISVANDVPFGLSAGLVTNDLRSVHQFVNEIQAGVVKVNRPTGGVDLNVPFGGIKASSTNTYREQGAEATHFFSWSKSVYIGV